MSSYYGWQFGKMLASRSSHERSYCTSSPVSTEMGIQPRYVTKPTRSTRSCIPSGSLNRVPALLGWGQRRESYLCRVADNTV